MADDIVERLSCIYDADGCGQCTFCLAKAEIERLRAAGDALAATYVDIWQCRGIGAGTIQRTYDRWLEARRG